MWGRPIPWTTSKIWALETGGPDETGVLWCGTLPGGLFRSADGGTSWELMRTLWDSPGARSGWAAAPTFPASIPSASTRAMQSACRSACPAAAW